MLLRPPYMPAGRWHVYAVLSLLHDSASSMEGAEHLPGQHTAITVYKKIECVVLALQWTKAPRTDSKSVKFASAASTASE